MQIDFRHAVVYMRSEDLPDERFHYDPAFEQSNWKLFHDALKTQHSFLLDEILLKYQLPLTRVG